MVGAMMWARWRALADGRQGLPTPLLALAPVTGPLMAAAALEKVLQVMAAAKGMAPVCCAQAPRGCSVAVAQGWGWAQVWRRRSHQVAERPGRRSRRGRRVKVVGW